MEVGIDIEMNDRFKNLSEKFMSRAYTKNEINYAKKCINSHERFCAIWCVKEAIIKAFSNRAIPFREINVLSDENGKPRIELNETILSELQKINATEIKISMSHTKEYSTAICVIN